MPVEWRDPKPTTVSGPVPSRTFQKFWGPIIEELKTRPRQWAMLQKAVSQATANAYATALRRAYADCEFTIRKMEVFGRYTPSGD